MLALQNLLYFLFAMSTLNREINDKIPKSFEDIIKHLFEYTIFRQFLVFIDERFINVLLFILFSSLDSSSMLC